MKIEFRLVWMKAGTPEQKAFKTSATYALFQEYTKRISRFTPCRISGKLSKNREKVSPEKVWVCDCSSSSHTLSSEELAIRLGRLQDSGIRELQVIIGGPDGLSEEQMDEWRPDLKWSFGPLTLPHELAAVVASEQIYRAFTILHHLPYHQGH